MIDCVKIDAHDNVVVALRKIRQGEFVSCEGKTIRANCDIPRGHKIALTAIRRGENVVKYGVPIGIATCDIAEGDWVHVENMKTRLSGRDKEEENSNPGIEAAVESDDRVEQTEKSEEGTTTEAAEAVEPSGYRMDTFRGFVRDDGSVGIRNEVWILPAVGCINSVAQKLAEDNKDLVSGTVDGIYAYTHPYGCSQTGEDLKWTRRILADLAKHPNAGSVLILELGCENLTHESMVNELGDFDDRRIRFLRCQSVEDEYIEGRRILRECVDYAATFVREDVSTAKLVIGLKCGGSDGLSGITANPVVGRVCDRVVQEGGIAIMSEVPEMFGAESMLLRRTVNAVIHDKVRTMIERYKEYFVKHNEPISENPSPGNKAGGISSLEDKSCGCVQKGGTAPIVDALGYGERIKEGSGLHLLYGPGNDLVSTTALTAAGAHVILFTTGRGTPWGAPAPTIKIATNTELAIRKQRWIDYNAGMITEGQKIGTAAEELWGLVCEVASGRQTKAEMNGNRGIAIFKNGVTL